MSEWSIGPILGRTGIDLQNLRNKAREVVAARYLGDYRVWLKFDNGREGLIDLEDDLWGDEHEALRDRSLFSEFFVDPGRATLAWDNGSDFSPEYLYTKLSHLH